MTSSSSRTLLLDGGMGTTLENLSYDVSSPLWGLEILQTNPIAVQDIHERFIGAGADIIETATYQLTPALLKRHMQVDAAQSTQILRTAVSVADRARQSSSSTANPTHKAPSVALSFGPLGSTLQPPQEYAGIYPPPYGPAPPASNDDPTPSSSSSTISSSKQGVSATSNAFTSSDEERNAIDALAQHHLSKLNEFAADEDSWRAIEWIAFETVPVIHEMRGIRRAMRRLNEQLRIRWGDAGDGKAGREGEGASKAWWKKKFWITSAFPNGQHPQQLPSGAHATVPAILEALLADSDGDDTYEVPDGVGINCTHPRYLASLADDFSSALRALPRTWTKPRPKPTFVLYPDGGQVYDTSTRTWSAKSGPGSAEEWARGVLSVAQQVEQAPDTDRASDASDDKLWAGVIIGGCCKTSFEEIAALRKAIDESV